MVVLAVVDGRARQPPRGKHKVVKTLRGQELQRWNLYIPGSTIQLLQDEQARTFGGQECGRGVDSSPVRTDPGDSD